MWRVAGEATPLSRGSRSRRGQYLSASSSSFVNLSRAAGWRACLKSVSLVAADVCCAGWRTGWRASAAARNEGAPSLASLKISAWQAARYIFCATSLKHSISLIPAVAMDIWFPSDRDADEHGRQHDVRRGTVLKRDAATSQTSLPAAGSKRYLPPASHYWRRLWTIRERPYGRYAVPHSMGGLAAAGDADSQNMPWTLPRTACLPPQAARVLLRRFAPRVVLPTIPNTCSLMAIYCAGNGGGTGAHAAFLRCHTLPPPFSGSCAGDIDTVLAAALAWRWNRWNRTMHSCSGSANYRGRQ